ncbi:hypothetical protein QBC34DRAFT_393140 [Podospora aff. communis PSN243]|uniref:Uncharacterized protein n=1 Tax=Podospora aff. communis PSN243 TaxID=3040156 RepID=A0AAV9H2Z5_9PEZI|nr:hypothetical protein QBC34DRAFT_393140 [Podospora aff. communis PSN243]
MGDRLDLWTGRYCPSWNKGRRAGRECQSGNHLLEIYALFMLVGFGTTTLVPKTKRKTLQQLAGEDDNATGNGRASGVHGSRSGGEEAREGTGDREIMESKP